jgi:hypothetical protein
MRTPRPEDEKLQVVAGRVAPRIRKLIEEFAWRDRTTEAALVREAVEAYVRKRLRREAREAA